MIFNKHMYISITVWDTLAVKIKVLFFHCWNNTESMKGSCESQLESRGFCWHSQTKWAELCWIEMSSETPRWHYSLVFLSCVAFCNKHVQLTLYLIKRPVYNFLPFYLLVCFLGYLPCSAFLPPFCSFSSLLPWPPSSCLSFFSHLSSLFPGSLTP